MSNIITAPQATSPLSVWLSYLEHLHSSAIDMGLERVGKVGQLLNVLRPAPEAIKIDSSIWQVVPLPLVPDTVITLGAGRNTFSN